MVKNLHNFFCHAGLLQVYNTAVKEGQNKKKKNYKHWIDFYIINVLEKIIGSHLYHTF